MDRPGPRRHLLSPPWLIAIAAAALSACQSLPQQAPWTEKAAEPPAPSWRVVERVGESRYLSPSMSGWEQIVAGSIVPAGSQISTGIGGRLILTQASNQVSAGTSSRFILPAPGQEGIRQTAGWLRYRITDAGDAFGIETPFLELTTGRAVVDVTVADTRTEVAVVSGRVQVKTLDDQREINLRAGYIGYASLDGDPLAYRRGPGLALESVPAMVIPALHPDRAAATTPIDASGTSPVDHSASTPFDPTTSGINDQPMAPQPPKAASRSSERPPAGGPGAPSTLLRAAPPAPPSAELGFMAGASVEPGPEGSVPTRPAVFEGSATAMAVPSVMLPATMAKPVAAPMPVASSAPEATMHASATAAAEGAEPVGGMQTVEVAPAPTTHQAAMPAPAPELPEARFDLLTEGLLDGLSPALPAAPGNRR